jgi:hypothetical protein
MAIVYLRLVRLLPLPLFKIARFLLCSARQTPRPAWRAQLRPARGPRTGVLRIRAAILCARQIGPGPSPHKPLEPKCRHDKKARSVPPSGTRLAGSCSLPSIVATAGTKNELCRVRAPERRRHSMYDLAPACITSPECFEQIALLVAHGN